MLAFYGAAQYVDTKSKSIEEIDDSWNDSEIVTTNNNNGPCVPQFKICNSSIACLHCHLFFVFTKQNYLSI